MKSLSVIRAFFSVIFASVVCATALLFFSPGKEYIEPLQFEETAKDEKSEGQILKGDAGKKIIGLIPGHYGYDSGFQCGAEFNFVKETDVNLRIAVMVRDYLLNRGYEVNLMHEFDPMLSNYTGLALVSIHANDCEPGGKNHSGFNVSIAGQNTYPTESERLADCLKSRYAQNTNLSFLGPNFDIGQEMLYSFNAVNDYTTISVIHTGFLGNDYRFISEEMEKVSKGIGDGIICYIEDESIGSISSNPSPVENVLLADEERMEYDLPLPIPLREAYETTDEEF